MDRQPNDIEQQIAAYLSGNCSDDDIENLRKWLTLSEENKRIFDDSVWIWENCKPPMTKSEIERAKLRVALLIFSQNEHQ